LTEPGKIESMYRSGDAPISITLPAGKYKLSVRKDGFETYTNDFQIQAGKERTVDVALTKATGAAAGLSSSASDGTSKRTANGNGAVRSTYIAPDGSWSLPAGAPPPAIAPFDEKKAKEHQQAWAKYLDVPIEMTNSIGMIFMLIPPGEFDMGSTQEEGKEAHEKALAWKDTWWQGYLSSETPQHHVRITHPFYMARYEVTQAQYERIMGVNPSFFSRQGSGKEKVANQDTKDYPVECVSHSEAMEFCRRLSSQSSNWAFGHNFRLPTAAEWEYACRAGTTTRWYFGDNEKDMLAYGWMVPSHIWSGKGVLSTKSEYCTHPVGQKKPNAWELNDVHGNVLEWCSDVGSLDYYKISPVDDPTGPAIGDRYVLRGGCGLRSALQGRSASQSYNPKSNKLWDIGFRLACDVTSRQPFDSAVKNVPETIPSDKPIAFDDNKDSKPGPIPQGQWVDLMPYIDVQRDKVAGQWELQNNMLIVKKEKEHSRLMLPVVVDGDYELEVIFTRTEGVGPVTIPINLGAMPLSVVLGEERENEPLSAITKVGNWECPNNITAQRRKFENGRQYAAKIIVQPNQNQYLIQVFLDNSPFLDLKNNRHDIGLHPSNLLPKLKRPGLGGQECTVQFHNVKIRIASDTKGHNKGYLLEKGQTYAEPYVLSPCPGSVHASRFNDIGLSNAYLIGLEIRTHDKPIPRLVALRPIYKTPSGPQRGMSCGWNNINSNQTIVTPNKTILAKDGYVINGMIVSLDAWPSNANDKGEDVVVGLKLRFARLRGNLVDLNDTYESDWIGQDVKATPLGGSISPAIGIFGHWNGASILSLGLVLAPDDPNIQWPYEWDSTKVPSAAADSSGSTAPAAPTPVVRNIPETIPSEKTGSEMTSPAKPYLLGYDLGEDSDKWIPEVASYTNIVWDCNWVKNEDARQQCQITIDAARKKGIKVVLSVGAKQNMDKFLEVGADFVKANRDVVFAICVQNPLYRMVKSEDVASFGARVKQALPGIQFWIMMVDEKYQQNYVIPSMVDLLVLDYIGCAAPSDVLSKTGQSLPIWIKKFDNRPIILLWDHWQKDSRGLVPSCQPATFRTLAEIVKSNNLAGLVFGSYGPSIFDKKMGVQTRPELVDEIKQIAREWGIEKLAEKTKSENTSSAKPYLLGYALGDDSAKWMPEVASYTNIVWECGWDLNEDARPQCQRSIDAARKLGLHMVLCVGRKQCMDKFLEVGLDFVKANRDVVSAICIQSPLWRNVKSEDLAAFGVKVKQVLPGIQFWIRLTVDECQVNYLIPIEVDLLAISYSDCTTPQEVQRNTKEFLPIWMQKFSNRPIILIWDRWQQYGTGLVPICQPETFRTLAEIAYSNHLAGLVFVSYGPLSWKNLEFIGIENRPELVSEIKDIAKAWKIAPGAATDREKNIPDIIPSNKIVSGINSFAKPYLLGYAFGDDSAKWIPEAASYTNVVWDCNWLFGEEPLIQSRRTIEAARKQGLQVVLSVCKKQNMANFLEKGLDLVRKNRDVVFAICMDEPPSYGVKPDEVTDFGTKVKQALPGIQFWMILVDNKNQQKYAIPNEVDLLVLNNQGCTTPQDIQRRSRESLPIWFNKCQGRPIVLSWDFWKTNSTGLVPNCQPETYRALSETVQSNHF
jgi:formylglycine-generating enzyme required for sulfatase activity